MICWTEEPIITMTGLVVISRRNDLFWLRKDLSVTANSHAFSLLYMYFLWREWIQDNVRSKRKKERRRKRNVDSGEKSWSHQSMVPEILAGITCFFFDVWTSHGTQMLTLLSFLKSNGSFRLFVWMRKFLWVQVFCNNCGTGQRRGKIEAVSETLKCIKHLSWFNIKWSNTWACLELFYFFCCNPGGHFCRRGSEYITFEKDSNCQYNMTATLFF